VARAVGAPKHKGAGLKLYKKTGDHLKAGEPILTLYADRESRLDEALTTLRKTRIISVGERMEMLMHEVKAPEISVEKFVLER